MRYQHHKETCLIGVLILAVSLMYFWPFRDNFFVYDDFAMIEHVIAGPAAVLKGYNNILRVVASALLWPLFAVSGHDPFGYNLFCFSLYVVNAFLFYFFCKELFQDSKIAVWATLFFVASAVGCDAVFWKAAYSTLLNVTFYFLTLILYIRFRREGRVCLYWFSIAIFFLAVLSKEESASLPFIIVAIEVLVFGNKPDLKTVFRIMPYCLLIIAYLAANYIIIYHVLKGQSELVKHSGFRPLQTLLAPWTAFFMAPDGRLSGGDIRIYLAALLIPAGILVSGNKKYYLFALAWVFLSFMPQSLSTLSQFEPKYVFNSVSRHLYLPSAGVALAFAFVLLHVRSLVPVRFMHLASALVLSGYLFFNYERVQERGRVWAADGEPARTFLVELKKIIPTFPRDSYVLVSNAPTGRAYVQQSLRAFYMNDSINWIVDQTKFIPQPGMSVFFINCMWASPTSVIVEANKVY
jgi:hypothetical protein